jgi:hypothetical protein
LARRTTPNKTTVIVMNREDEVLDLEMQLLDLLAGHHYPVIMHALIRVTAILTVVDPGKNNSTGAVKFLSKKLAQIVKDFEGDPETMRQIREHYSSYKLQ